MLDYSPGTAASQKLPSSSADRVTSYLPPINDFAVDKIKVTGCLATDLAHHFLFSFFSPFSFDHFLLCNTNLKSSLKLGAVESLNIPQFNQSPDNTKLVCITD